VRRGVVGTFDNFNPVIAMVKGNIAAGTELFIETLTTPAYDEISTEYGLLAEAVSSPDDHSSVSYRLRANARWHDGKPVTPDDVIFSFDAFKQNSPYHGAYYRHVTKVEKTSEREITFTFDGPGNRELPQIVGQLPVLQKHWWEGADANGKKRDVTQTTLEPPIGSGPYRVKDFAPGRSLAYEKVAGYWGKGLNVNIGTNNFEQIRFDYYRDSNVALEAFKGDQFDWRTESVAKDWATAYDFPAVLEKKVLKEEFPIRSSGGMQAFAFNIRRDKFKDPRVRRAFNFALDFEEMNKQLFFGQYKRVDSYFFGTELASSGLPSGKELEILETVRDKVPNDMFTKVYSNPVGGNQQANRNNLREALALLREAGYEIRDTKLINTKTNERMAVELLVNQPPFERVALFYKPALERLGILTSVRTVDSSQYENRLRQWDYDMIIASWGESLSPGNEQRSFWGSQAADQPGSRNLIGIKNPAVDTLIERVIFTKDRDDLVAATKALDRVLLWNYYVVPNWSYPFVRSARWDRFGHPDTMPKYAEPAFPTIWWFDPDKAAKVPQRS
jgi:microcin C transport system substrate-binding protein